MAIDIFGVAMTGSIFANSAGLCLDIVGAILLFCFGLSPKLDRTGAVHLISGPFDVKEIAKAKQYDFWSRVGLLLLITGFGLQLAGNFV